MKTKALRNLTTFLTPESLRKRLQMISKLPWSSSGLIAEDLRQQKETH
jgi:hypothetical protein